MTFITGFRKNLSNASRVYVVVALVAPVLVFLAVEGWRVLAWLAMSDPAGQSADSGSIHDRLLAGVYLVTAAVYVADTSRSHRQVAVIYTVLGALHVLGGTMSIYGLLSVVGGLVPSLSRLDIFDMTCVSMSLLLATYVLFHRRLTR
jgi:hypothetical protein